MENENDCLAMPKRSNSKLPVSSKDSFVSGLITAC